MHVTLRLLPQTQSVRTPKVFKSISAALAKAREQFGFRLAHFSVQSDHIHLIAEADDRSSLTRGMMGLTIRVALAVNRALARAGRVFAERYHARQLRTPLEVRRALLYVLRNDRKHLAAQGLSRAPWHLDPCSSAAAFEGWADSPLLALARRARTSPGAPPIDRACVAEPHSFLLRIAWRRHGLIGLEEEPRA